jgi:hypothetical protein
MPQFDPGVVQVMKSALEEAMTRIPSEHSTVEVKAHLAEYILRTAARGQTSYDGLVAVASSAIAACVHKGDGDAGSAGCQTADSSCPVYRQARHR